MQIADTSIVTVTAAPAARLEYIQFAGAPRAIGAAGDSAGRHAADRCRRQQSGRRGRHRPRWHAQEQLSWSAVPASSSSATIIDSGFDQHRPEEWFAQHWSDADSGQVSGRDRSRHFPGSVSPHADGNGETAAHLLARSGRNGANPVELSLLSLRLVPGLDTIEVSFTPPPNIEYRRVRLTNSSIVQVNLSGTVKVSNACISD